MKYGFILLCLIFCFPLCAKVLTVEKTLADISGEMISLMDLKEARKRLKNGFFKDSPLLILFSPAELKQKNSALLNFLIYRKILDLKAAQSRLTLDPARLKKALLRKKKNSRLSKKAFSRKLVKNNFTSSSYKIFLKKSLLRKQLIQREVGEKIKFSDEDLNEYARQKEGKALFTSFEYELAYLLFPPTAKGDRNAKKVFKKISKENSFFDKWKPKNPGEKKDILKNLKLSTLNPAVQKAVKPLSVGQISGLLLLPSGHHIFKAVWKSPVIRPKDQKRKARLSRLFFKELFKKKLKAFLTEEKKQFFVNTHL